MGGEGWIFEFNGGLGGSYWFNYITSTHVDREGNIIYVLDDGDLGIYKYDISLSEWDGKPLNKEYGKLIGFTPYWDTFVNEDGTPMVGLNIFSEKAKNIFLNDAKEKGDKYLNENYWARMAFLDASKFSKNKYTAFRNYLMDEDESFWTQLTYSEFGRIYNMMLSGIFDGISLLSGFSPGDINQEKVLNDTTKTIDEKITTILWLDIDEEIKNGHIRSIKP